MKYKISYLPEEGEEAAAGLAVLQRLYPAAKVRESDAHPPFKHIYLTTKKPANPPVSKEDVDIHPP